MSSDTPKSTKTVQPAASLINNNPFQTPSNVILQQPSSGQTPYGTSGVAFSSPAGANFSASEHIPEFGTAVSAGHGLNLLASAASSSSSAAMTSGGAENPDEKFERLLRGIAGMSVNDAVFAPKQFTGTPVDDDVKTWLTQFERYANFRALDPQTKLQLFQMLLKGQAAEWLNSQPEDVRDDFDALIEIFKERFALTDVQLCQRATKMWGREQQSTESVDAYITDITKTARQLNLTDDNMLRFAVIRGLRPAIRLHVLQSNATTLDDVIKAARTADAALQSVPDSSATINELATTMKDFMAKFQTTPAVAPSGGSVSVVTTERSSRRESQSPRRVRFQTSPSRERSSGERVSSYQRTPPEQYYRQRGSNGRGNYTRGFNSSGRQSRSTAYDCRNCMRHHTAGLCAAYNAQCFNCNRRGHFAKACRSQTNRPSFQSQQRGFY